MICDAPDGWLDTAADDAAVNNQRCQDYDIDQVSFQMLSHGFADLAPHAKIFIDIRDCAECELFGPAAADEVD